MGREHENSMDLVGALKQYELAVTVNPLNQEAIDSAHRVEIALHGFAEKHYRAGLKLETAGKYAHARQQFLIALRLWPDHPEVINVLTTKKRIQIKRYIVHTVKTGDSVAKLAKVYYGDSQKFSIIAKYNDLGDATRIHVGQKIKIPEIKDVDFLAAKEPIETEALAASDMEFAKWDWEQYALEERPEPVDQVAIYRNHAIDLFRKKEYQLAIVEFDKVINVRPEDKIALIYSHKSHYQLAMDLFNKRNYLRARDQFESALRYSKDCHNCKLYIKKSEELYKETHYKRGIRFFDKERLSEAIKEWERVRLMDPNYKKVNELIKKARTLLKKIEELKESQKS
ncbi:MAG: LysM peptidoglycan-binding domain-containing protein [Desulfobacteraceae bacterium]|nr:MAG: LysM peptidoglycan-binding domain-containing protein [Desulfobacteraceae bacterium]